MIAHYPHAIPMRQSEKMWGAMTVDILAAVLSLVIFAGLLLVGKAGADGRVKPFLNTEWRQVGYTFAILIAGMTALIFGLDAISGFLPS